MVARTGFRQRRALLSGLGMMLGGLFLVNGGWAFDEEKAPVARARPTADSSGSQRQASSTRPSSTRPSSSQAVAPQRSTGSSTGSSSTAQRQPTARDTRAHPPGQWKPPGGSGGGGGGGGWGGHHPSWGWGHRYPWYWNRYCWGWPSCWGWGWGYWGPYWYYPPPAAYPLDRTVYSPQSVAADLGALNLVIKPKKADVYVDGRFVGRAKDFDGYPGYLWLKEGSYEISLVRDGYVTFSDRIPVRTGQVVDVELRLEPGLSTPPRVSQTSVTETEPEATEQMSAVTEEPPSTGIRQDVRVTPGLLELVVRPADASVYLDGRLLGSGQELTDLHAGLIVDPGAHSLDMVRPGYEAQRLDFEVESGQTVNLQITLERDGR